MKKGLINTALIAGAFAASLSACGPMQNKAKITINSEPPDARVYQEDVFMGKTPLTLEWDNIPDQAYSHGFLVTRPFTVGKDGYLPQKRRFKLGLDPSWRDTTGKTLNYYKLFVLESDPNSRSYTFKGDVTNRNEDSDFDRLNKGLDAIEGLYRLKSLNPRR